ncbi:F-box and associated interaction domains-containing protein [Raphanus sativus]|uniref:F-box protein At3g57590-like n=1 Tax=Raphanus sativus TaxID=3726 RepID=A0A6J0M7W9_RAPSA|nr:F-box protein At3g57590-like [Raphanus sativus]KAJ4912822.1 F-box and associated interaction domains-containing protein [Raphanus sativus]
MHNSIMSTGEEELVPIPNDLIVDIFSRLPAESVARCRCLSKLWGSILHRPYFTELLLTRSWARPRLLFALKRQGSWSFYSLPQLRQDLYHDNKASPPLVAYPDFHLKFPEHICPEYHGFTSGLIFFSSMRITPKVRKEETVICKPRTGQYASVPKLLRDGKSFLGFDPIGKQFKVLFIDQTVTYSPDVNRVLTLGNGIMEWRKINCPWSLFQCVLDEGICINGILFFLAKRRHFGPCDVNIVCFDVRSEEFKCTGVVEWDSSYAKLVNYKGKLGVVTWKGLYELSISVLEDVEKHEWSEYVYTLPENNILDSFNYFIAGVTATGEIVFSRNVTRGPFYVVYFSLESSTLQSVEIRGLESGHRVCAYVDLVEDIYNVNDAKYLKSSPRLNDVITIRPKPKKLNSAPSSVKNEQSASLLLQNRQWTTLLQNKLDMLANFDD